MNHLKVFQGSKIFPTQVLVMGKLPSTFNFTAPQPIFLFNWLIRQCENMTKVQSQTHKKIWTKNLNCEIAED